MISSRTLLEADEAAAKLSSDTRTLEHAHIREEYEQLLQRTQVLLTRIKELKHGAPDAVATALHKLQMAQGKMQSAIRQEQERGSWQPRFPGLGLTKSSPRPESFLVAEKLVAQASADLHGLSTATLSTAGSSTFAAQGAGLSEQQLSVGSSSQQQQMLLAMAEQTGGIVSRYMTAMGPLGRSITAINLQPGPANSIGNLWVFLHSPLSVQLDLYVGCDARNIKTKSMSSSMKVTCIAYDDFLGLTWTGHADGAVRVHRTAHAEMSAGAAPQCNIAMKHCQQGAPIHCMAVVRHGDGARQARCWVGDEDGRLGMLAWLDNSGELVLKNTKTPDELWQAGSTLSGALSLRQAMPSGPLLLSSPLSPSMSGAAEPKGVPVLTMLCLGRSMLVSGGISLPGAPTSYRLELWDCKRMEKVKQFSCTGLGAATCLELVDAPSELLSVARSSPARQTSIGSDTSSHSSLSVDECDMRLLSGHTRGQVVLWRLQGRGKAAKLHELAIIGDPRDRPIKAVLAFPHWDMLVAVHSSGMSTSARGKLDVMHMPSAAQIAAAETRREASVVAPHRAVHRTVDLQVSVCEAHQHPILTATRWGDAIVTASRSTLRMWSPQQLAQEAMKDGLTFTRVARASSSSSSTTMSTQASVGCSASTSLDQAACARTDSDPSPFQLLQSPQPRGQQRAAPIHTPAVPISPSRSTTGVPLSPSSQVQVGSAAAAASSSSSRQVQPSPRTAQQGQMPGPAAGSAAAGAAAVVGAAATAASSSAAAPSEQPSSAARGAPPVSAPDQASTQCTVQDAAAGTAASAPQQQQRELAASAARAEEQLQPQPAAPREEPQHKALNKSDSQGPTGTVLCEADVLADIKAELAAHCGYVYIKQLPDQSMFGASRALLVRCNRTNRLRTLLQIPRAQLQQLDHWGLAELNKQLIEASQLHHPHTLQVQEVFLGPLHLHIVLEECSAGRLVDFPAQQHSMWGAAGPGGAAAALNPDFARWFFQQVVLAVDYYHGRVKSLPGTGDKASRLSVKDALLKVAPNLPQPVVKVPTAVLAHGIAHIALPAASSSSSTAVGSSASVSGRTEEGVSSSGSTGSSSSSQPSRDPFIPPEAFVSLAAGGARPDTAAGDVWACGVLLLKLLGGTLTEKVYDTSISKDQLPASDLFILDVLASSTPSTDLTAQPGRERSVPTGVSVCDLLARMLQPNVSHRCTISEVRQHHWFTSGLPAAAGSMTQRYLAKGTACKQPVHEIHAAVMAAAAAPHAQPQRLIHAWRRQRKHRHTAPLQQQQPFRELAGPLTPELLYNLRLQLRGLEQASVRLHSTRLSPAPSSSSSSSASRLTELLVAQQAECYVNSAVTCVGHALRAMQQLSWLQHTKLSLHKRAEVHMLGMALLLQSTCSQALYSTSRLQQLLQGVQQPQQWHELQHSIPQGKRTLDGQPSADALHWRSWLLQLQVYLLVQAHQALLSLWRCSAVAAAVAAACMGPAQVVALAPSPKPHMLTAVAGPSTAARALAGAAAALLLQLPQYVLAAPEFEGKRFVLSHAALFLHVLLLVWLNDGMAGQLQVAPAGITRMRLDTELEDMDYVTVSTQPLQDDSACSATGSSCVAYKGRLLSQSKQDDACRVMVVGLAQLLPPDVSAGPPPHRVEVRSKRQQERDDQELRARAKKRGYLCPICLHVMKDPVFFDDGYTYGRGCIEKHINKKKAAGKEVRSPLMNTPVKDTSLKPIHNLRSDISEFLREEEARLKQRREQQQQHSSQLGEAGVKAESGQQQQQQQQQQHRDQQNTASSEEKACEHMLLAHAAQPHSHEAARALQHTLVLLQDAKLLSSSCRTGAAASSSAGSAQQRLLLAPITGMCLDPPLLVMPQPPSGTLEQWLRTAAGKVSGSAGAQDDFTAAWVASMPWSKVLQVLIDVAAALSLLHQQQPPVVHGGVHAAAINLLQQLAGEDGTQQLQQQVAAQSSGQVCQLSLVGLLSQLAPIRSCHPFLAAPEVVLAAGPATAAADVYGFGVLMFQLATGWLPQQYTPGTDEQISAVLWCRDMLAQVGSTSPLAAAQQRLQQQQQQQHSWTPYDGYMPSRTALEQLPAGYVALMEDCLQRVPPLRPVVQEVLARLQNIAGGTHPPSLRPLLLLQAAAVQVEVVGQEAAVTAAAEVLLPISSKAGHRAEQTLDVHSRSSGQARPPQVLQAPAPQAVLAPRKLPPSPGYMGVVQSRSLMGVWKAQILFHNKAIDLGTYDSADEAARVWNEAALLLLDHRVQLNPVEPKVRPGHKVGELHLASQVAAEDIKEAAAAAGVSGDILRGIQYTAVQ